MKKSLKKHYTKKYFEDRDILITHLALTIKQIAKENHYRKILDIGCGSGQYLKFLQNKGFEVFGVDHSLEAVKMAAKNRIIVVKASATKLPFKTASFDLVLAISLIEHLSKRDAKKFISEVNMVLKPGGSFFLVTPNFASPLRLIQGKNWFGYSDPTHINFFTPASLSKTLRLQGFGNLRFWFKTNYSKTFDWEFPLPFFPQFPMLLKKLLVYFFFSSPGALYRNSVWVQASKE